MIGCRSQRLRAVASGYAGPLMTILVSAATVAAVLVIVIEAVLRVGKRALKNNTMRVLAAAAFLALFLYDVPFPIVILVAGLIGYFGGRAGVPAFLAGGGHGKLGDKQLADADSLLGEETPEHARPNLRWSLSIAAVLVRK